MLASPRIRATSCALALLAGAAAGAPPLELELAQELHYRTPPACCPVPAYQRVNESAVSRAWFAIAAFHPDSGFHWPARDTIELVLKDGREVRALEQFAMTPPGLLGGLQVVPLAGFVSSERVYRQRARHARRHRGQVGTVLFVAFPRIPGMDAANVADVRIGRAR